MSEFGRRGPQAARQLTRLLDDLHKGRGRRGGLSVVRQMTTPDGGAFKGAPRI
jgi:hypothetical protein